MYLFTRKFLEVRNENKKHSKQEFEGIFDSIFSESLRSLNKR